MSVKNYDIKPGMLFSTSGSNFHEKLMDQFWRQIAGWPKEGSMRRNEGGVGRWVCAGIKFMEKRMQGRAN